MLDATEYQAALDGAPDAILIVDTSGKIKFANQRVETVFGYAPDELLESSVDRLVPADYRATHASHRAAFARSPGTRSMGSVVGLFGQRKDGSSVPVEISLAPIETTNGLRVVCSVREATLHQSELSRLFMAHMPGAAAMLDAKMRYIAVTKAWLRDYGLRVSASDVVGRSHYELFPEIPEHWREIHRRALRGESSKATDDSFIRSDGRIEWVDWEIQPWRTVSGQVGGIFIFSEVTTARHEAAAALAESESRFKGAFEYSLLGMALVAPDGRWLRVNQALCDMLGYTSDELLATNYQALSHADDLNSELRREVLEGRRSHYRFEKRYHHKAGHVIWALVTGSLVRDASGRPLHFVSQIQDITDRKLAFERIRALAQRLETFREHERREVSQLIHEGVMQDLTAVSLALHLLRDRSKGRIDVLEACGDMSMALDKCFVDLRQLANDLRPTVLAHLPLAAALSEHAEYFSRLSKIRIEVIEEEPLPVLDEATKLMLFRAAQEALTNVARHAQAKSVKILLRANAAQVSMDVVDDGIGIDKDALSRAGSLGLLGLSERFRSVGGDLRIGPTRGKGAKGTTLSVFLPLPSALTALSGAEAVTGVSRPHKARDGAPPAGVEDFAITP
jgi:PAS domain S-box-containing protein